MRLNRLFVVIVCSPLLACGAQDSSKELAELQGQLAQVSAMTFTASTSTAQNPPPALDLRVDDAGRAEAAYAATLALPAAPDGIRNCPIDFGVMYHIAYLDEKGATVLLTEVDPEGCRGVQLSGTSIPARSALSDAYWQQLAQSLGIAEAEIYPYPAVTP